MHDDDSPRSRALPGKQDEKVERAVLFEVLDEHPDQLAITELVRRIADDPEDTEEREKVLRAVGELAAAGVLQHSGETVSATAAALRVNALLGETC